MHKKDKKLVAAITAVMVVLAIGYGIYLQHKDPQASGAKIVGVVTGVTNRPNVAEDGYNGISLTDDAGISYTINATGYLNTPMPPDQNGEECVDVPKVVVGDKIEFNLPKADYGETANTYDICYKKGSGNYFLKVVD